MLEDMTSFLTSAGTNKLTGQLTKSMFEPANEKGDLMIFLFVVLQMRLCCPLFGLQVFVFYLKFSQGLYYISANNKDAGETVLMCGLV